MTVTTPDSTVGRVVIVGGGIVGTMHAVEARRRGWEVVQLERDVAPRSATVRNFGMVWISGRAVGLELDLANRSRELWAQLAADGADVGFRACGSLTVVRGADEVAVLEQVVARHDAGERGVELLDADATRRLNPHIGGDFSAALLCRRDAKVEPRMALRGIRDHLIGDGYTFLPGRTVTSVGTRRVIDQAGVHHDADLVIICPGAVTEGAVAELVEGAPIRRVRLQMMQTAPLGVELPTMLADADSLRYYPGFDVPARADMTPPSALTREFHLQLLCSQRLDGALTIGDTHHYDEPFDFDLDERPYEELAERLGAILGRPLPPVVRRWAGVYSQCTDGRLWYRAEVAAGVHVVTGPGGRGMTLSAAIGEETFAAVVDGHDSGATTPPAAEEQP